jgi:hypothetical protein
MQRLTYHTQTMTSVYIGQSCMEAKYYLQQLCSETRTLNRQQKGARGDMNDRGRLASPIEGRWNLTTSPLGTDITRNSITSTVERGG